MVDTASDAWDGNIRAMWVSAYLLAEGLLLMYILGERSRWGDMNCKARASHGGAKGE